MASEMFILWYQSPPYVDGIPTFQPVLMVSSSVLKCSFNIFFTSQVGRTFLKKNNKTQCPVKVG